MRDISAKKRSMERDRFGKSEIFKYSGSLKSNSTINAFLVGGGDKQNSPEA